MLLSLLLLVVYASRQDPQIAQVDTPKLAFYHWKSNFTGNYREEELQKELGVERVYLRFFDVVKDMSGKTIPIATVRLRVPPQLSVVPVIYIENDALRGLNQAESVELAHKIVTRTQKIIDENRLDTADKIQLDCDWTATTRESFFHILRQVKKERPLWEVSSTLRLHQLRYPKRTGIPPADSACLMAYNMGSLREFGEKNSILDVRIASEYLKNPSYPLPLDVTLPLFSWGVLFRKDRSYGGLVRSLPSDLTDRSRYRPVGERLYQLLGKHQIGQDDFAGGYLRVERSETKDVLALAEAIARSGIRPRELLFYHMEEEIIERLDMGEIKKIATVFK